MPSSRKETHVWNVKESMTTVVGIADGNADVVGGARFGLFGKHL